MEPLVVRRPIYKRWWFWVLLLVLVLLTWYLKGYFDWLGNQTKYEVQNSIQNAYMQTMQRQQTALEEKYKNDPYGGATPEETLRLFIEALEKKDYTLAANYFVPERVEEYRKDFPLAEKTGGVSKLINAYNQGKMAKQKFEGENKYEVSVYPQESEVGFRFEIILNPFTQKWLIGQY